MVSSKVNSTHLAFPKSWDYYTHGRQYLVKIQLAKSFHLNGRKLARVQCTDLIVRTMFYYMEESVLLGTKPLVDSIRHFIREPSGVFSVCHLCECRIVQ